MITIQDIKNSEEIKAYIKKGNQVLLSLGYTEHSFSHVGIVEENAVKVLKAFKNVSERDIELCRIACYMHDIGNCINRVDHAQSGAVMAFTVLNKIGMEPSEIADICCAIGNHDEELGQTISPITAALIIGDKCDVRRSRVQVQNMTYSIHGRVNFAVTDSKLLVDETKKSITLKIEIDTSLCSVADYFEIFLKRMLMCKKAAEFLGGSFHLEINDSKLL